METPTLDRYLQSSNAQRTSEQISLAYLITHHTPEQVDQALAKVLMTRKINSPASFIKSIGLEKVLAHDSDEPLEPIVPKTNRTRGAFSDAYRPPIVAIPKEGDQVKTFADFSEETKACIAEMKAKLGIKKVS